ncbi:hypothetical protein AXFE_18080 [Acidithrix ferrooxidans]|uniref:Uncharacterized protein n=1 Tax=Acidithrix ferrooxidans TaxID=1280514 RepID=A0A0D8HJT0_9ACTN|nr:hypothetical protein AXFE_18080 [Acidithrix ferrooxidans]
MIQKDLIPIYQGIYKSPKSKIAQNPLKRGQLGRFFGNSAKDGPSNQNEVDLMLAAIHPGQKGQMAFRSKGEIFTDVSRILFADKVSITGYLPRFQVGHSSNRMA